MLSLNVSGEITQLLAKRTEWAEHIVQCESDVCSYCTSTIQ